MFTQNAPTSATLDSAQTPPSIQNPPESASKYAKKAQFHPIFSHLREEFTESLLELCGVIPLFCVVIPRFCGVTPFFCFFMPNLPYKNLGKICDEELTEVMRLIFTRQIEHLC
jgi:hypothetical protein